MHGSTGGGGEQGVRTPLKNHKFIGFPSNTGLDPLKIRNATKPAFNEGHYQPASEMPFQWRFAGRLIVAHFWCF